MDLRRAPRFILSSIFLLISAALLGQAGARLFFVPANVTHALPKKVAVPELIPLSPQEKRSDGDQIRAPNSGAGGPSSQDFPIEQIDLLITKLQSELRDVKAKINRADYRQNKKGRTVRSANERLDRVPKGELDSIEGLIKVAETMREKALAERAFNKKTREDFAVQIQELSETKHELLGLRSEIELTRRLVLSDIANRQVTSEAPFAPATPEAKTDLAGIISAVAGVASLLVACFVMLKGDALLDRLTPLSNPSSDVSDFIAIEEMQGETAIDDDTAHRGGQTHQNSAPRNTGATRNA